MTFQNNPYRLDRSVVPSAYQIHLSPDLVTCTFDGHVDITVEVREATSQITLNARDLGLTTATLTTGDLTLTSAPAVLNTDYETATFTFAQELPLGSATLSIDFTGEINDKLTGFYRSTYVDPEGNAHTIATTQFENCSARRAFPSWDEPAFKATYQTTLTVASDLAAYSNTTEIGRTELADGRVAVQFAPTMVMSTYLVAFIVGPFEHTDPVDVDGVPLRIVYPKGQGHLTALALESSIHGLKWFSNYFGIPYPGDKVDMVAVPDFTQGAMENMGCITYRMSLLLIDPETASLAEKERVAGVIHHELAHMWFGNLVTMEWWQGIWLNEAFATFMQVLCTNAFRPEWKGLVQFGTEREISLQVDGLHSTRPIEYEVISPDDTRGMFDVLTYEKGGSTLRMIEQWLGAETFRQGISTYLKKHSYANTVTADLWNALEEASGEPVGRIMDTFITQGGHPLVTFADGVVTQEPFAYGPARGTSAIGSEWLVPLFTRSLNGGAKTRHLLGAEPLAISDESPVVVNADGAGVFRTRYGTAEMAALAPRTSELDSLEFFTLFADTWANFFASRISWENFKTLAVAVRDSDESTAWGVVSDAMAWLDRALLPEQRPLLRDFVVDLYTPAFERFGFDVAEGESERIGQLRASVLLTLGLIGQHEGIKAEARRRFEANTLDGDIANAVLRIVASDGLDSDYEEFLARRRSAKTPQEEMRYLRALAGFSVEPIALDAASRAFSEFRTQDGSSLLGQLCANRVTGQAVWRYVTSRWDDAAARFPTDTFTYIALGVPTFITDPAFAAEVEAFHTSHSLGGQQKRVEQFIERMHVGLAFTAAVRSQF